MPRKKAKAKRPEFLEVGAIKLARHDDERHEQPSYLYVSEELSIAVMSRDAEDASVKKWMAFVLVDRDPLLSYEVYETLKTGGPEQAVAGLLAKLEQARFAIERIKP